jgi:sugar lactone lactonase YvrE
LTSTSANAGTISAVPSSVSPDVPSPDEPPDEEASEDTPVDEPVDDDVLPVGVLVDPPASVVAVAAVPDSDPASMTLESSPPQPPTRRDTSTAKSIRRVIAPSVADAHAPSSALACEPARWSAAPVQTRTKVGVIAAVAVLGYLTLWPVEIDPVGWTAPDVPEAIGVLAPNEALRAAEQLALGHVEGPEDVAVDETGRMFVGTRDGRIAIVDPDGNEVGTLARTGGRPLGLAWDRAGNLIVADAVLGLLSVSESGTITTLSTESEGAPFAFTDDVDVATDGRIYFSDASDKFGYGKHMQDTLEGRPHGRLLRYDPSTRQTETLLDGLYFANGVALAEDDAFVLVNETGRFRVTRYWLIGEREGTTDTFNDAIPGYPDGISRGPRGTFWVALFTVRNPTADALAPYPFLRKLIWRLPRFALPKPEPVGYVLELDQGGSILRTLQDPGGTRFPFVTSVEEVDGRLYLGSLEASHLGRLTL